MTTIQAIHHVEQMQAARAEFAEFWKLEHENRSFIRNLRLCDKVEHEITAWNAFLKGKGLK
jgi:hypothetical protein